MDFVSQNDLVAPTKAQRPWIMEIAGNTQVVEPELGRSSNGGFRIRLLDRAGEMVRYFADVVLTLNGAHNDTTTTITTNEDTSGYPMIGTVELITGGVRERVRYTGKTPKTFTGCTRGVDGTSAASHSDDDEVHNGEQIRLGTRCQLKTGYAHLAEASWCDIQKMEVVGRTGHQDRVSVVLKIADINRQPSRATVFLTASQTAPRSLCGNPIDCALAVLISGGGYATQTGTIAKTVGSAAIVGTTTTFTSYTAGDILRCDDGELIRLSSITDDTHATAAQNAILTGTGLTFRKGGTNGKYDVLDAVDALGLPVAFVDVTTWEALRTSDFPTDRYQFSIVQPHNGKTFVEEQFFKTMNCYPKINQTGQLSILRYRVAVGAPTVTLDQDVIRAYDWMPADEQIINRVHFRYDFNVTGAEGQYGAFVEYLAGTKTDFTSSLGKFGPKTPLVVEAMGWRSTLGAATLAANRAEQTTDRFAFPQTILALDCHYTQHHLEVGDQVYVNDARIPNIRTGGKGITNEVFEVLDVTPSWRPYHVAFTLLWVAAIPTVAAPVSQGVVTNENPYLTGPVGEADLDEELGSQVSGFSFFHQGVFTGSSPRASYREGTQEFSYTQTSGDILAYEIAFRGVSATNTVGGVDLAAVEREEETAASATATTLVLNAAASGSDDAYNDMYARIVSNGTPAANGLIAKISDYVGSTKTATVPTWATTPTGTITYEIIRTGARDFGNDQNGVSGKPTTELGSAYLEQWAHREIALPSSWDGKRIISMATAMDGAPASQTQVMLVRNAVIKSSAAVVALSIARYAFSAQPVWDFGSESNVTATVRFNIVGDAARTRGIVNLGASRWAYAQHAGGVVSTTPETIVATFTDFVQTATIEDAIPIWIRAFLQPDSSSGTNTCVFRLRENDTSGAILLTVTVVATAGVAGKGGAPVGVARLDYSDFILWRPGSVGAKTLVFTADNSAASQNATIQYLHIMAGAKSA